jgi:hypothetical protein
MKEGRLACLKNGREGLARTACNDLLPWLLLLLPLQARLISQHQAARHLHKQAQLSLSTTALLPRLCSLFSLCHVESPPRPNVVCLAPLSLSGFHYDDCCCSLVSLPPTTIALLP